MPGLVVARDLRIAENGSLAIASNQVCQMTINNTGWVQSDPSLRGGLNAFLRLGDPLAATDPRPRGQVIIEDDGLWQVLRDADTNGVPATYQMYMLFGTSNSVVNQIILRDNAEMWLPGPTEEMASIGDPNNVVSLQTIIDLGLLSTDQAGRSVRFDDSNAPTNTIVYVADD